MNEPPLQKSGTVISEECAQLKVTKYFSSDIDLPDFHCALPWPEGSGGVELQGTNLLNRHRLID